MAGTRASSAQSEDSASAVMRAYSKAAPSSRDLPEMARLRNGPSQGLETRNEEASRQCFRDQAGSEAAEEPSALAAAAKRAAGRRKGGGAMSALARATNG